MNTEHRVSRGTERTRQLTEWLTQNRSLWGHLEQYRYRERNPLVLRAIRDGLFAEGTAFRDVFYTLQRVLNQIQTNPQVTCANAKPGTASTLTN